MCIHKGRDNYFRCTYDQGWACGGSRYAATVVLRGESCLL